MEDNSLYDPEYCYECGGYGDDYSFDKDTSELVCNCFTCPFSPFIDDDD